MELALLLPVIVLLTFGAIDMTLAWRNSIQLTNAASNGALHAIGNPCDQSGVTERVRAELNDPSVPVTATKVPSGDHVWPCTTYTGDLRITASRSHTFVVPDVLPAIPSTITLTGTETVRALG